MRVRDIPNLLTIIRVLLVVPVCVLLLREQFGAALSLIFLAGFTDWFDGYLARRNGWQSRLGSILDPLADKLLIVSTFVVLGWLGLVPYWLVIAVLVRDVLIVAGGVAYHVLVGEFHMQPTLASKLNTAVQIAFCVLTVFAQAVTLVPEWFTTALVYITLTTTILSGADYIIVWSRKACRSGFKLHLHD